MDNSINKELIEIVTTITKILETVVQLKDRIQVVEDRCKAMEDDTEKRIELELERKADIVKNSNSTDKDFLSALKDICMLNKIRDEVNNSGDCGD